MYVIWMDYIGTDGTSLCGGVFLGRMWKEANSRGTSTPNYSQWGIKCVKLPGGKQACKLGASEAHLSRTLSDLVSGGATVFPVHLEKHALSYA